MSVLDGWLGGPQARDAFGLILSQVGQSRAMLLPHTEKLPLTASALVSLPAHTRSHLSSCFLCALRSVLPPGTSNWHRNGFLFCFYIYIR